MKTILGPDDEIHLVTLAPPDMEETPDTSEVVMAGILVGYYDCVVDPSLHGGARVTFRFRPARDVVVEIV